MVLLSRYSALSDVMGLTSCQPIAWERALLSKSANSSFSGQPEKRNFMFGDFPTVRYIFGVVSAGMHLWMGRTGLLVLLGIASFNERSF